MEIKILGIIKKVLRIKNVDDVVEKINIKTAQEAENATALINEMNRKLVLSSVAFRIYRASGHNEYGNNNTIAN